MERHTMVRVLAVVGRSAVNKGLLCKINSTPQCSCFGDSFLVLSLRH